MGLKKAETAAVAVTLLFAALTLGFRLGQGNVPARFSVRTVPAATAALPTDPHGSTAKTPARASESVNINTATLEALCALPGIGESLARRVIEYREENGPFARIEDITRVSGIGSGIFHELRDQITVE